MMVHHDWTVRMSTDHDGDHGGDLPVPLHLPSLPLVRHGHRVQVRLKGTVSPNMFYKKYYRLVKIFPVFIWKI